MSRHSRELLWGSRPVVLVAGKDPRTFWRMPTDLASWTADMEFGMGVVDGRIVAWSANPPGPASPQPTERSTDG
jgi:hypothetical protein